MPFKGTNPWLTSPICICICICDAATVLLLPSSPIEVWHRLTRPCSSLPALTNDVFVRRHRNQTNQQARHRIRIRIKIRISKHVTGESARIRIRIRTSKHDTGIKRISRRGTAGLGMQELTQVWVVRFPTHQSGAAGFQVVQPTHSLGASLDWVDPWETWLPAAGTTVTVVIELDKRTGPPITGCTHHQVISLLADRPRRLKGQDLWESLGRG